MVSSEYTLDFWLVLVFPRLDWVWKELPLDFWLVQAFPRLGMVSQDSSLSVEEQCHNLVFHMPVPPSAME